MADDLGPREVDIEVSLYVNDGPVTDEEIENAVVMMLEMNAGLEDIGAEVVPDGG